jgi:uridine monophosphate synthetase
METFFSLLDRHTQTQNTLLCIGLDPHPSDLPEPTAEAALEFCLRLIQGTARYAAAFKPNAAFFELYGPEGWAALKQVVDAIEAESHRLGSRIPVILDAKRGDIASTAEAYAQSAFEQLGAHGITLSPYLGQDSIAPFLTDREKGVFLLCKTSNPGASDVQDLKLQDGDVMYERIARLALAWNGNGNVGLVVGATQPEALARVRAIAPEIWVLAPGVGAQGGDLATALTSGLRADGSGMLLPVSRAISRSPDPTAAARQLRDDINVHRQSKNQFSPAPRPLAPPLSLATDLLTSHCVRFGQFTLKSGQVSPIYLDLRRLITHPAALKRVAQAYAAKLRALHFDRIAGIPYAGLPIATAVALEMERPLIYPRREAKDYGTKAAIEGEFAEGETVVMLDDLATTGGTKIEAMQKLESAGLKVKDIVVLIDREQGAGQMLAEAGYRLHAVTTLRELLSLWHASGAITTEQFEEVSNFLQGGAEASLRTGAREQR